MLQGPSQEVEAVPVCFGPGSLGDHPVFDAGDGAVLGNDAQQLAFAPVGAAGTLLGVVRAAELGHLLQTVAQGQPLRGENRFFI